MEYSSQSQLIYINWGRLCEIFSLPDRLIERADGIEVIRKLLLIKPDCLKYLSQQQQGIIHETQQAIIQTTLKLLDSITEPNA